MVSKSKKEILKELQKLPNTGPRVAEDIYSLGYRSLADMKRADPDKMYAKLEKLAGAHVDRCMLYVCRALVYMAKHPDYNKKDVSWWYFKDKK